ncbi:hypothetical protein M9H77_16262 [Catharanthus roseus]|uniref:Uncharacterized protein n=1 Tax=Catharanthus roseus TaxID=4058 RepID=A0ACC0B0G6_CATRO|nr:hypothetical protein M9H77_16262 [Catharanthus roseus]
MFVHVGFARGAATLAYLYWGLGHASRVDAKELSGLDIPVFSYVCTSSETGSEVVQTVHLELILFVLRSTAGQQITGVHGQECVHRGIVTGGTVSSAYVYMDQCPCSTII